jgi:hypothetical protein
MARNRNFDQNFSRISNLVLRDEKNSSEKIQGSGAMEGTAKVLAALAHVIALDRGWFGHG